ncbi:MAG: putative DCC family thiol-disulfide oxidoreductase YuxK [Candidatus Endobugula sp.]|jgi:predicted DCC family thiol-disulfide oxidoreductase YuxK
MKKNQIFLIYDKECPACDNYCQVVRIRESVGELNLIDARENSDVLREITDLGLDIDQGMVLKMEDKIYYGADAIHALALISSRSGVFNQINYWLFKSKTLSSVFYPALKFCRNMLLQALGKTKINNLNVSDNNRF